MDFKFDINKIEADYRAKIATLEEAYSQVPQRQLKFRIWDKHSETFVDNSASLHCFSQWMIDAETGQAYSAVGAIDGDHSDNDQRSLYRDHERFRGPDGAYIIQQWTGLTNKNGNDIYKGDFVKIIRDISSFDRECCDEMTLPVEYFPEYGFKAVWGHKKCNKEFLYNCEVVGNILENPELNEN